MLHLCRLYTLINFWLNVESKPCVLPMLRLQFVILQRWAVYSAAKMLTKYSKEYQALQQAMQQRASIDKCVAAIEQS